MMWFAVLGPLEIFDDQGRRIILRPARQRLVLAALLCASGRPVSTDRLIDLVWSAGPPANARTNLQGYISEIRRALGDRSRIRRDPAGYSIRVGPAEADWLRAERLFQQAEAAGKAADLATAATLYRNALALWRGEPYEGMSNPEEIGEEAARLAEVRLTGIEQLFDAELALGHHARLVPEIAAMVARHPLRERFCGQLMLAYVRCDRQADALAAYRATRNTLVEELGVEPGSGLRELQHAILMGDPSLEIPGTDLPSREQVERPPRPMEIPPDLASFTGRFGETTRIRRLLTDAAESAAGSTAVVAVAGAGGTGKSALAVHVAHAVAGQFPDGVLYVNLRGATSGLKPLAPAEALGRFLRSLGARDTQTFADTDEAASRFRSLTADRRLLVVLDNAAETGQITPLLPGGSTSAVLLTSRRVLASLDGACHIQLGALSEPDAIELLAKLCGRTRVREQPAAAAELADLCGRLPLAVRIVGARLAARPDWSLTTFAKRLADTRRRLDELRYADLEVRSSFSVSLAGLDAKSVGMFELLGLIEATDLTAPVAAAAADQPVDEAQVVLDTLVDAQLLETRGAGRYGLHDLMRLYARGEAVRSIPEVERVRAVRRVLHHYLGTARAAAQILTPATEPRLVAGVRPDQLMAPGLALSGHEDAIAWADAEHANVLAAAQQAASEEYGQQIVIGLAAVASSLLDHRGHPAAVVTINRLAVEAAQRTGDQHSLAQTYNDLAVGCWQMGRLQEATTNAQEALVLWRRLGFRIGEAKTLNLLGILVSKKGQQGLARSNFLQALKIRRELGHRESQAAILTNIGLTYREQGELDEALARFEAALTLYRMEGASGGEGFVLGNIGKVRQLRGQLEQSVADLEHAVSLAHESGQRRFEAEFRWYLGESLHALGRRAEARDCWRDVMHSLVDVGVLTAVEADNILNAPIPHMPQWLR